MIAESSANVARTMAERACHFAKKYWCRLIPRQRTASATVARSELTALTAISATSARLATATPRKRSPVCIDADCTMPASWWMPYL